MKKLTDQILKDVITPRPENSFKGTFGKVTLIGGNRNFGGAIIMASTAAVCAGAGLVTTATDEINASASMRSCQKQCSLILLMMP